MAKETEKTKHSPLPWALATWRGGVVCGNCNDWTGNERYIIQTLRYGKGICATTRLHGTKTDKANAKFIVHCVNAYVKLVEALEEIEKGEGPFARDQLKHAENTIESMKQIARAALAEVKP